MLAACGVPFESVEVRSSEQMQRMRDDGLLLLDQLPMLETTDGEHYVQSMAIVRHLARTNGMYASSSKGAALCD